MALSSNCSTKMLFFQRHSQLFFMDLQLKTSRTSELAVRITNSHRLNCPNKEFFLVYISSHLESVQSKPPHWPQYGKIGSRKRPWFGHFLCSSSFLKVLMTRTFHRNSNFSLRFFSGLERETNVRVSCKLLVI